jgi:hypothetical protein
VWRNEKDEAPKSPGMVTRDRRNIAETEVQTDITEAQQKEGMRYENGVFLIRSVSSLMAIYMLQSTSLLTGIHVANKTGAPETGNQSQYSLGT